MTRLGQTPYYRLAAPESLEDAQRRAAERRARLGAAAPAAPQADDGAARKALAEAQARAERLERKVVELEAALAARPPVADAAARMAATRHAAQLEAQLAAANALWAREKAADAAEIERLSGELAKARDVETSIAEAVTARVLVALAGMQGSAPPNRAAPGAPAEKPKFLWKNWGAR
ncbi:hypothetical protein [Hansschlegelia zhihuaiae]|uniref:Uncharacterized protein n=1 Tax=Hansschlegelia zhihuaiae TaxID=405005 RepID=A0A4Q0MFW6_9HYPH|nr:hypothetical protein [Hansschlegelia zhihuaiae]RXF72103.1 hypothetical protein EK403_14940 [Hansschlegelia zhihuaiae]